MRIFITYAREDASIVTQLGHDLERSQRQVWIDQDLTGGQAWWDEILNQIRTCDLYVFALSPTSLRSRACVRELEYAHALDRPLLAIKVAQVSIQQAPRVVADSQVVDYVTRTPESVLALRDALDAAPPPPPLPDPLPEPPAVPISYFGQYREQLSSNSLPFAEQQSLLLELKNHLDSEDDRDDAVDLLKELRRRPDLAQSVAGEIDTLLASSPAPTSGTLPETTPAERQTVPSSPSSPRKKRTWLVVVGVVLAAFVAGIVGLAVLLEGVVPPAGCPAVADGFSMPAPETEYGPFGEGYYLAWHQPGGFSMYDPYSGQWAEFPDPGAQTSRDVWQTLGGSPFDVCVDNAGSVFGRYAP